MRKDYLQRLKEIQTSASSLQNALQAADVASNWGAYRVMEELIAADPFKSFEGASASTLNVLADIATRAAVALAQSYQADFLSARGHCALIVAEAWRVQRNCLPSKNTSVAWEAANFLWLAAGGEPSGNDDNLARWERHVGAARKISSLQRVTDTHDGTSPDPRWLAAERIRRDLIGRIRHATYAEKRGDARVKN